MTLRRQQFIMRLLIVAAFVFCGAAVYLLAYWLACNDQLYKRVFFSPFGLVARIAGVLIQFSILLPMIVGLLLGLSVVAAHARKWLVGSLFFGLGVFLLCILLL
jgi:uncharacterized membrane protein